MRPRVTVKVGDPVYAEKGMPLKRAAEALRDKTLAFMKSAATGNEVAFTITLRPSERLKRARR